MSALTLDERWFDRAVQALVDAFHPRKVVLFGSHARAEARADSDVDLLVIAETELDPVERSYRAQRAIGRRPVPVDVLVYTPAEIALYGAWTSSVAHAALREGKTVYEAA